VDLSELHQSLGMFGSGWAEFAHPWGLVGLRLGLVGPWLGPVGARLDGATPGWRTVPAGSLYQFVTSLAAAAGAVCRTRWRWRAVVARLARTAGGDEGRTRHATGPNLTLAEKVKSHGVDCASAT
jgi:hypothetical protein